MKLILHLICATRALLLGLSLMLFCLSGSAQTQDTSGLGLRLTQSITHITDMSAITSARIVSMDYGSATVSNLVDTVTSSANPTADPRITAQTQSYGDGAYTIPEIETSARANLLPQQTSLIAKIRSAAASARVSGAVWVFNQTVRPTGATRPMKITWYLMLAPGGRVITSEPKVVEEDPTVVYITYYSKAVGKSLPASYAWAEAGLLKWQLRRYDGSPVTDWTTVNTAGAYDSTEGDSEVGPRCLATAQTIAGCVQGYATARTLMSQTASRKALMDYVRAVDASYTPGSNGDSTPDIKIAFDVRQYTRISCTAGSYRCAGSVGYTVVEAMDRYSMTDTEALPTKVNSIKGLNSSRPSATFDVSVGVSDKPAVIDPFVINPFDQPLALVAQTAMPGIIRMASLQVEMPPAAGEFTCPAGTKVVGNQCVSTFSTPANETFTCPNGSIPSGSTCLSTTTTSATPATTYTCPSGGTPSGSTCYVPSSSYSATPSTTFSCPSGGTASGSTCNVPGYSYSGTPSTTYSCPSGGTRSGSTCNIPGYSYSGTPSTTYSCPSGGTASGSTCNLPGSSYSATPSTTYSCPSGGTRSGSTCNVPGYSYSGTPSTTYSCPSGGTRSGSTCNVPGYSYSGTPSTTYSCPSGGTASGSTCNVPGNSYTGTSSTTYSCPSGGDRSGSTCLVTTSSPPNANYDCSHLLSGGYIGSGMCRYYRGDQEEEAPAIITYSCTSGNMLFGTCFTQSSYTASATVSVSCPNGGTASGSTCNVPGSSYSGTPSTTYSCPSGGSASGSTCNVPGSSYSGTPSTTYSCPSGGTASGSTCNVPGSSYSGTPSTTYSCPNGGTASGSTCILPSSSYSATPSISYSCTTGVISGNQCIRTNTSSATSSYSCVVGDLIGSSCLTQTSAPASWVPLTCPD